MFEYGRTNPTMVFARETQSGDLSMQQKLASDINYQSAAGNPTVSWRYVAPFNGSQTYSIYYNNQQQEISSTNFHQPHPLELVSFTAESFHDFQITSQQTQVVTEIYQPSDFSTIQVQESRENLTYRKRTKQLLDLSPREIDLVNSLMSLSNDGKDGGQPEYNSESIESYLNSQMIIASAISEPKPKTNHQKSTSFHDIRITKYEASNPPVTSGWLPYSSVVRPKPSNQKVLADLHRYHQESAYQNVTTIVQEVVRYEEKDPKPEKEPQILPTSHCSICNKSFSSVGYYKQHFNVYHTGDKPFRCHCGKKFKEQASLESHQVKHNNDTKPYDCTYEGCNRKFQHKNDAKRHSSSHELKANKCKFCGKSFMRGDHLKKHYESHARKVLKGKNKSKEEPLIVVD